MAIAMFNQGRVRSHVGLWLYARALDRFTHRVGIDESIVFYKPGDVRNGFVNEVEIKGRLGVDQWTEIAAWSRHWFPSLRFGKWIDDRVKEFRRFGSTPDERSLEFQQL
jgi:hypothetical protein